MIGVIRSDGLWRFACGDVFLYTFCMCHTLYELGSNRLTWQAAWLHVMQDYTELLGNVWLLVKNMKLVTILPPEQWGMKNQYESDLHAHLSPTMSNSRLLKLKTLETQLPLGGHSFYQLSIFFGFWKHTCTAWTLSIHWWDNLGAKCRRKMKNEN